MSKLTALILALACTAPLAGTVSADPVDPKPAARSGAIRRPIEGTKDEYSDDIMKLKGVTAFAVATRGTQKVLLIVAQDVDARLHVQALVRDQIQGYPVVIEIGPVAKPLAKP